MTFAVSFLLLALAGQAETKAARDVTFLSISDTHYDAYENEDRNGRVRETVLQMNGIAEVPWPKELGGGAIPRPRGVVALGDLIDDGDRKLQDKIQGPRQWEAFAADFGLDGTDGLLKYPVYEGWGNHDGPPQGKEKFGFSLQAELKKRNAIRKEKGRLTNLSENGLHYSWDWDDVHFVQLNLYPADRQHEKVKYSATWHDPQGSLSFLKEDVAKHVGASGRPVVLMSHCGFDTDWWPPEDWKAVYEAMKPYNIILYLYGHTGTGIRDWAPEGESRRWPCINDGHGDVGFFVIRIQGNRIRFAYRCRIKEEWGWRFAKEIELPGSPPLLRPAEPPMKWADASRGRPFSKDPCVIRFKDRYWMYYSIPPFGDRRADDGWAIGVATSRDLTAWEKAGEALPEQECERKGICAPGAIVLEGKVHLFYQTYGNGPKDAICHAVSEDGLRFVRDASNPVFRPSGGWTVGRAIDAEAFPVGDRLLLYYATRDPAMKVQMVGVAGADLKSGFGRDAWKPLSDGPILKPELDWEKKCIEAPSVCRRGDKLFMFYAGAYNNQPQQIGVASSRDGLSWKRLSDRPFLPNGPAGSWNESESGHPGVFAEADGATWLFYQGNRDRGKTWYLSRIRIGWRDDVPVIPDGADR
jgi:cytolysin (calcineurin-like family phosphatase)/predicted GH43/DUF377 family glycosyl hydrolase